MKNNAAFIESGILELYIAGIASPEEVIQVEEMSALHADVRDAIESLKVTLEDLAIATAVEPSPLIKPFLMATMDFMGRMEAGEAPSFPPELNENSTIDDYAEWLNRPDMIKPDWFKDIHARIIGYTPQMITAIVWIETMAPDEVHDDEYEKFLIVEGTCDINIDGDVHHLVPGDYLAIPLYKNHVVQVTSEDPCKVILQRVSVAA
jgi:mannose-6-phosphate isomerase-like protein (cupin superfamily)